MKNIFLILTICILVACSQNSKDLPPPCESVTYMIGSDTAAHWHSVCGEELQRFKSYPRQSYVMPPCDMRIMTLIIQPDKCVKMIKDSTAKSNIEKLPEYCYSQDNRNGNIIKIMAGMMGFYSQEGFGYIKRLIEDADGDRNKVVDDLNKEAGVTPIQKEAMEIGSMFGWEVPGANVDNYEIQVIPKQ